MTTLTKLKTFDTVIIEYNAKLQSDLRSITLKTPEYQFNLWLDFLEGEIVENSHN